MKIPYGPLLAYSSLNSLIVNISRMPENLDELSTYLLTGVSAIILTGLITKATSFIKNKTEGYKKTIRDTTLSYATYFFALNQIILPAGVSSVYLTEKYVFPQSGSITYDKKSIEELVDNHDMSQYTARDILNISNMITTENAEKNSVCRHYTKTTQEIYDIILKECNRENLKDDIRVMLGYDKKLGSAHAWIEINENNQWIPYETLCLTPKMPIANIPSYSKKTALRKSNINISRKNAVITGQSTTFGRMPLPPIETLISAGFIGQELAVLK